MNTVEHYNAERVPNPNPRGATPYKTFEKVRQEIIGVCRKHGVTGPDDNPYDCDVYVVDDQYNDELYHYVEVYNRKLLSPDWVQDMMAAVRRFRGWGAAVKNIRFAYLLIFGDKLMVTGYPFAGCDDIESVAAAASANLWGVKGEEDPYIGEQFHREDLLAAPICGCYHCCAMFPPSQIVKWTNEDDDGVGQTAVCPRCGQSKVIAPKPSSTFEPEALRRLSELAFGPLTKRST
jgi:hypothetical protein